MLCAATGEGRKNHQAAPTAASSKAASAAAIGKPPDSMVAAGRCRLWRSARQNRTRHVGELRGEAVDRPVPAGEGIDPLARRQFVGEGVARLDIFDAQREHRDVVAAGERQLLLDLVGIVGGVREHQHHRPRLPQRAHDRFLVILTRRYVAAGNPAAGRAAFERHTERQRLLAVGGCVADKNGRIGSIRSFGSLDRTIHEMPPRWKARHLQVFGRERRGGVGRASRRFTMFFGESRRLWPGKNTHGLSSLR